MYIIEFENGGKPWWIAPWEGDPGRTFVKRNAQQFRTEKAAKQKLKKVIKENVHRNLTKGNVSNEFTSMSE